MKYYRIMISIFLLISLGYFSFLFFDYDQQKENLSSFSVQDPINGNFEALFTLIYQYYQAIEVNDWTKIKTLVTPGWWAEINRSGYKEKWQNLIKNDPTIDFVMFMVIDQKNDQIDDFSWVIGKANWASSKQKMEDENQTIFFSKENDKWKISQIRLNLPVETVDNFSGINF